MESNNFKPVVGYESIYLVDINGVIISIRSGKPLKSRIERNGYRRLCLTNNGVEKYELVHRIIAKAFIENPENKPCINHINGIKTDNRIENLEWCTYSENRIHALNINLCTVKKGIDHHNSKLTEIDAAKIREMYSYGEMGYRRISKIFNVHAQTIKRIVTNKAWK